MSASESVSCGGGASQALDGGGACLDRGAAHRWGGRAIRATSDVEAVGGEFGRGRFSEGLHEHFAKFLSLVSSLSPSSVTSMTLLVWVGTLSTGVSVWAGSAKYIILLV